MLTYGIEIWVHDAELTKTADSFIYSALKRLFDLPIATPHRAILSKFGFIPTAIRYRYICDRMRERYQRFNPLDPVPLTSGPAYRRITNDTPISMTIAEQTDEYP